MSSPLATLRIVLGLDARDLQTGMGQADQAIKGFGTNSSAAFKGFDSNVTRTFTAAGAAVGAFAAEGIGRFSSFEKDMNEVFTLLPGITNDAMAKMTDDVKLFSAETGKLPEEIIPSLYKAISAGVPPDNVFDFLRTSNKAAVAGAAETEDAVALLTTVTKGYGDTSEEAVSKVSDLALKTVELGQTTFPELAASMGAVVPIAAAMNTSNEELFASYATLTGVTGNTAAVTTQLKAVYSAMANPNETMKKGLAEIGFETGEAAIQSLGFQGALDALNGTQVAANEGNAKLFGSTEALTAVLALTGAQADVYADKLEGMGDAAGATETKFATMDQGIQTAADKIMAGLNNMLLDVGKFLGPVGPFAQVFGPELRRVVGGAIGGFGGFLASQLSPELKGGLTKAWGALKNVAAAPIRMAGAAASLIYTGAMKLVEGISSVISAAWGGLKTAARTAIAAAGTAAGLVYSGAMKVAEGIASALSAVWSRIASSAPVKAAVGLAGAAAGAAYAIAQEIAATGAAVLRSFLAKFAAMTPAKVAAATVAGTAAGVAEGTAAATASSSAGVLGKAKAAGSMVGKLGFIAGFAVIGAEVQKLLFETLDKAFGTTNTPAGAAAVIAGQTAAHFMADGFSQEASNTIGQAASDAFTQALAGGASTQAAVAAAEEAARTTAATFGRTLVTEIDPAVAPFMAQYAQTLREGGNAAGRAAAEATGAALTSGEGSAALDTYMAELEARFVEGGGVIGEKTGSAISSEAARTLDFNELFHRAEQQLGAGWSETWGETAKQMQRDAAWAGAQTPGAFSEGLRSNFDTVKTGFEDLRDLMKNTLDPAKQEAEVVGILTSQRLAKGLADGRPEVHAQAEQVALDAIRQLHQLDAASPEIGRSAMRLLASATEAEKPAIRTALREILGVTDEQLDLLIQHAGKAGTDAGDDLGDKLGSEKNKTNAKNNAGRVADAAHDGFMNKPWGDWGNNVGWAWVNGLFRELTAKENFIDRKVDALARDFKSSSPPKYGPLREIAKWGEHTFDAWVQGGVGALERGAPRLASALERVGRMGRRPDWISPRSTDSRAANAGGGGDTYNVHIHGPIYGGPAGLDELIREIQRRLRFTSRGGRLASPGLGA